MKNYFRQLFDNLHKNAGDKAFLRTTIDAIDTFMFVPKETTSRTGVQIRDRMDLKRTMFMVVIPLLVIYLFASWNIGHQHYLAGGMTDISWGKKFLFGLFQILPIFVVTHVVGLAIEILFASKKGHAVEEGFLVTGALIPLIMPPTIPLWILALSVAFAVVIAKEAFGGTGMNIWNVALTARVFVFFAYPTVISGDVIPVLDQAGNIVRNNYVWIATGHNWLHHLFSNFFNVDAYKEVMQNMVNGTIDAYSGATPLAVAAKDGYEILRETWSWKDLFMGHIAGSSGEMFKPVILLGAVWLLVTQIASWRIMLSFLLGMTVTGILFNAVAPDTNLFMQIPWYWHYVLGSALFAMAFMATDPVTAAQTNTGKWIYGFLIGMVGMIVRVINPAYPEGWMLAILFLNTFAPLIDYNVITRNIKKRLANGTN